MPLTKREVSPVYVSRGTIPEQIRRDELQCCANGTLANLIRQLASISKHAENIFGEIYHEAVRLDHKTNTLQQRMERLATRIGQLDTDTEQASLEELQMRKSFKSSCLIDQHTLDRSTLPIALEKCYEKCDPPPNLNALNPYRESAVPALSLYTNPSFFFDLWRREMLKDCGEGRRRMRSPNQSPRKKKNRPPQQEQIPVATQHQRQQQRYLSSLRPAQMGVLSFPEEYQAPQALGLQLGAFSSRDQPLPPPPESLVAPIGMSMPAPLTSQPNHHGRTPPRQLPPPDMSMLNIDDEDEELPPPPPATIMQTSIVQQLPPPPQDNIKLVPVQENQATSAPPPPPPPPPPLPPAGSLLSAPTSFTVVKREENGSTNNNSTSKPVDTRTNLLAEIQNGIKLKKVQRKEEEEEEARAAESSNDVAAILKRRMFVVMGNRDDEEQSEESDGEWDDD